MLNPNHIALVDAAMTEVRARFPEKSEDDYRRAESTLKTSVKRIRRGTKITWSLSIPELNLMLTRVETL